MKGLHVKSIFLAVFILVIFGCDKDSKNSTPEDRSSKKLEGTSTPKIEQSKNKAQFAPISIPSKWLVYFDNSQKYADTLSLHVDSTFRMTSIEIDDVQFGQYHVSADSLYLTVLYGKWDEDFQDGSRHRTSIANYVLIQVENGQLKQEVGYGSNSTLLIWEQVPL